FSFQESGAPRHLHSFPTRRSSDLKNIQANPVGAVTDGVKVQLEPGLIPLDGHGPQFVGIVGEDSCRRRIIAVGLKQRGRARAKRSEEHTSELQSLAYLVCRLLLEK